MFTNNSSVDVAGQGLVKSSSALNSQLQSTTNDRASSHCPDCGIGLIRLGSCFSCPACGYGSCG